MKLSLVNALNASMLDLNDASISPQAIILYKVESIPEDEGLDVIINSVSSVGVARAMQIIVETVEAMGGFTVNDTDAMRELVYGFTGFSKYQTVFMCTNTKSGKRLIYTIDIEGGYKNINVETCVMTDAAFAIREIKIKEHYRCVRAEKGLASFVESNPEYPKNSWVLTDGAGIDFTSPTGYKVFGFYVSRLNASVLFGIHADIRHDYAISVYSASRDKFNTAFDNMIDRDCNSEDDKNIVKEAINAFLTDPVHQRSSNTVAYHSNVIKCPDGDYTFHMRCFPNGFSEMFLLEGASEELIAAIKNSVTEVFVSK